MFVGVVVLGVMVGDKYPSFTPIFCAVKQPLECLKTSIFGLFKRPPPSEFWEGEIVLFA